MVEDRADVDS